MIKDKLGRIVSSRAFYIIFSVLASVALWLYVEMSQNPDVKSIIENVPIVYVNEDVLLDKGLVPTSKSPEMVTLTYEGKRGILPKLTNTSVYVTVDLASISSSGWASIPYKAVLPSDVGERTVSLVSKSVERISIRVERMFEKTVEVRGRYDGGTVSNEYMAGTPEFSPNTLTVRGPEEIVSRIDAVWVDIKRTNLSSTLTEEMEFTVLDTEGNALDEDTRSALSFEPGVEKIRVTVPVKMVKDVPLTVNLMYGAGATEQNTKFAISPSIITLSGEPDIIREYNSITLGTIDLTKLELSESILFPIVVENNFTNESGVTEALVTVEVLGCEVRRFQTENLSLVNKPKGYEAVFRTQSVDVRVRGKPEELDALTEANIRIVADLANYSPGTSQIPARVYIDGDVGDVGAVGEYTLTVTISRE